jgi:hypothetical protein
MNRTEWKATDREYRILVRLWYETMLENTKKADAIWNATLISDRLKPVMKCRAGVDLLQQREESCFDLKKGRPYKTFASVDLP